MPDSLLTTPSGVRSSIRPVPPHIPDLDGVDRVEGFANMGNDPELYLKMLKKAAERYPLLQNQLASAMLQENQGEIVRILHTFKGLAGTIGAMELQQHASAMETAWIQTKKPATVPDDLLRAFHAALQRILNSLAILT